MSTPSGERDISTSFHSLLLRHIVANLVLVAYMHNTVPERYLNLSIIGGKIDLFPVWFAPCGTIHSVGMSVFLELSVEKDCPEPGGDSSPTGDNLGKVSSEVIGRRLASGLCRRAEVQANNCPPPSPSEHLLNRGEKLSFLELLFGF